jgi:hypothetical protein
MLTKYLAVAAIGSAFMIAPALAQSTSPDSKATMETKSGTASSAGLWQASKLSGLDIYNQQNEKIGDITELMLDKSGKIDSVVIGVGGFLGMGQHDVAVKFSDLKFSDQPVRSSGATGTTTGASGGMAGSAANRPATGAGTAKANPTYPDHAVLANATKEQLKAMPAFEYSK